MKNGFLTNRERRAVPGLADVFEPGFVLPADRVAVVPPEIRGTGRDDVRLMVSFAAQDRVAHSHFRSLEEYLSPGDLLVINTSRTMPAALRVVDEAGREMELHLSTRLPGGLWSVELRQPSPQGALPFYAAQPGSSYRLPGGGSAFILAPHLRTGSDLYQPIETWWSKERPFAVHKVLDTSGVGIKVSGAASLEDGHRLWIASLYLPAQVEEYLEEHGFPIRYGYIGEPWPLSCYQTVYATESGSAEMPSAGRAFTPEILTRLIARGVEVAPLILHTGVASLQDHEPPYEEFYRVTPQTARLVNMAHQTGQRVIAVGTTVIRALETVTDEEGVTHPGEGWTNLVITPDRGIRSVTGLLTGFHEPGASHLAMLQALLAGGAERETAARHLSHAYQEALSHDYLWHEFGDLHLIEG